MPKSDKLLVLDLDKTLIRTFEHKEKKPERKCDFVLDGFPVYKRPGLDDFLNYARSNFPLGVWSQGNGAYVDDVVENLFQKGDLDFQWCYDECSLAPEDIRICLAQDIRNLRIIKDVNMLERKLIIPPSKTIIVDDEPAHFLDYQNLIQVKSWEKAEEDDNELEVLKKFLSCLVNSEDVRKDIQHFKIYKDFCVSVKSA